MSVRIGTPTVSAHAAEDAQAFAEARARGTTASDVRFALSYDALKTNGTPARRAMSRTRERRVDGVRLALDDARARDEHQRVRRRCSRPPMLTGMHAAYPTTDAVVVLARRELVPMARVDEAGEQRMRLERLRLELGVELHRDVPRMRRQLDDLDELAVERAADDLAARARSAPVRRGS